MIKNPAGIQDEGSHFALDFHFRNVCNTQGPMSNVKYLKFGRGVMWELSTCKWQLMVQEHNAIAHGKCVRWDTKAKVEPRKN